MTRKDEDKAARLAEALRQNLRRRKDRAREAGAAPDPSSRPEPEG